MKKYIHISAISLASCAALCLLMLLGAPAQAQSAQNQDQHSSNDTTEVIVGNKVVTITIDSITGKKDVQVTTRVAANQDGDHDRPDEAVEIKPVHTSFIGIDLGINFPMYNGSFNAPASLSDFETEPLRSTNVGVHLLPTHFNMAHGKVSILTAITFDNNRYQFRNNVSPQPGLPTVTMARDSVSLRKNKLNMWYGQIPLMLCFQTNPTNPKRNFHVSLGGFAGLFLGANTKQKSEENGKVIRKDDFNLNPMRYGVSARIGFSNLELYTNYTLSPIFREGQGPAFNNINFGIALTGLM
jgi:Outer membrane protein beta-barrel domain